MHELFASVLAKRDLSRAGDLFQVLDSEIEDDLTEVVSFSFYLIFLIFFLILIEFTPSSSS